MPRAIATEKRKETLSTEDAMAVRLLQWASWASHNSRAVITGAVVLIAIGVGIWYYIDYQRSVLQQAAVELETLRATAAIGSREEAVTSLNTFIQRFGGTVYADEARLMLGRLSLDQQDWQAAVDALATAESNLDTPLGFGAAMLLGYAYEGLGDTSRAVEVLSEAASGARYGYQRHEALEEQARVLANAGDYDGAVAAYEAILEDVDAGQLADRIRARRAEAQALGIAAGG
jgi:predicted negative regulator of RcsB-dependent stress response